MDYISSESTIVNMMEFMDPFSSAEFRRSEKRMKSIMDSVTYWGSPEKKIPSRTGCHQPHEPYHVSPGLSTAIHNFSYKRWKCVSCASTSNVPIHPFYNTVVCKRCIERNPRYTIMGEKAACKKYFIKPEDTGSISRIEKSPGVFRVLEHQVRNRSETKHGKGVVKTKIEKRKNRSDKIFNNRISSYNRRVKLIYKYTRTSLDHYRVRIDPGLMDIRVLTGIAISHSLKRFIFRDTLDFKVTSSSSVMSVSDRLVDFACLMSFCRRNGVITDDYTELCPYHEDLFIASVFMDHCYGKVHYYEYMSTYIRSIESLKNRSKSVLAYTSSFGESFSQENRYNTSLVICLEEGVSLCPLLFDEYIRFGVGDPVLIGRECRKIEFLRSVGYDEDLDYFHIIQGMCMHMSSIRARDISLSRCGGFPIMERLLIDSRISGLKY